MTLPILEARLANAENYAFMQRLLRRVDLRAEDGHAIRATRRVAANRQQRRLDWMAHEELWRTA